MTSGAPQRRFERRANVRLDLVDGPEGDPSLPEVEPTEPSLSEGGADAEGLARTVGTATALTAVHNSDAVTVV